MLSFASSSSGLIWLFVLKDISMSVKGDLSSWTSDIYLKLIDNICKLCENQILILIWTDVNRAV